jgi:hypothetical protein
VIGFFVFWVTIDFQALREDNEEIFATKASPAPLNDELVASIQAVFKIPVQNCDQIKIQFRVRF